MPQDAARLNRLQIREQEQLNRERAAQVEAEERRQAEAARRGKSQYSYVRSHGYGSSASGGGAVCSGARAGTPADDAQIRVYVRECDAHEARSYTYWETAGAAEAAGAAGAELGGTRLPPVQRGPHKNSGGGARGSRSDAGVAAGATATAPMPQCEAPNKGRVPRYLQLRKAEMAAEKDAVEAEARRRRELAKIPPGQRLVSEEEKAETLARLGKRRAELEAQLGKIPIRFDTQAIRIRRANIDEELAQIETQTAKYSTTKPLYVPL